MLFLYSAGISAVLNLKSDLLCKSLLTILYCVAIRFTFNIAPIL